MTNTHFKIMFGTSRLFPNFRPSEYPCEGGKANSIE